MTITGQSSVRDTQNDASLIEFIARKVMNGMATTTLVRIVAVNGDTVDVEPLVHQIDGAGVAVPHGTIHNLPFFTLRAGPAAIRAVPVVGDIGMASFCHSDTSSVRATKDAAPPPSRRRFDWADGLYLGGFLGPTATTWIDVQDGQVEVKATTIKLTGAVEVMGDVQVTGNISASGAITATGEVTGNGKVLSTHTHGGITTGTGTSGPPS